MKMATLLIAILMLGVLLGVPAYLTNNGVLTQDNMGEWLQNNILIIWGFYPKISVPVPVGVSVGATYY